MNSFAPHNRNLYTSITEYRGQGFPPKFYSDYSYEIQNPTDDTADVVYTVTRYDMDGASYVESPEKDSFTIKAYKENGRWFFKEPMPLNGLAFQE